MQSPGTSEAGCSLGAHWNVDPVNLSLDLCAQEGWFSDGMRLEVVHGVGNSYRS